MQLRREVQGQQHLKQGYARDDSVQAGAGSAAEEAGHEITSSVHLRNFCRFVTTSEGGKLRLGLLGHHGGQFDPIIDLLSRFSCAHVARVCLFSADGRGRILIAGLSPRV